MASGGHQFFTPTYTGLGERAHLASPSNDSKPTSMTCLEQAYDLDASHSPNVTAPDGSTSASSIQIIRGQRERASIF